MTSGIFLKLSKLFVYTSLVSLILVSKSLYFPFVTVKTLWFRVFVELALASLIIYLITNPRFLKQIKPKLFNKISLAVFIFVIVFLITALMGVNPANSIWSNFERGEGAFQIIHYAAFFFLVLTLFSSKKDWRKFLWFFAILSFYILAYAVGQLLLMPFFLSSGATASGTFGNASYFGDFTVFLLFFLAWLFFQEKSFLKKLFLIGLAAFSLVVLYLSATIAAFLSLAIGAIIILWLSVKKSNLRYKNLALFSILALSLLSAVFIWQTKGALFLHHLKPRFWTWGSAIAGTLERPLLGWGAENFPGVFDKYYNPRHFEIESWFDRAHNIFFEYLVSGGLFLLLAYLLIFFFYYKTLRSPALKESRWRPLLFAIPIIYLIQGMTLFEVLPLYITLFVFLAFFVSFSHNFFAETGNNQVSHYQLTRLKHLLIYCVIIAITAALYLTTYLPLRKNLLLMQANSVEGKAIEEIFGNFENALAFYSPVGQNELEETLFLFSYNIMDALQKQKSPLLKNKNFVGQIASFNGRWFEKDKNSYVGVKNLYIYTLLQLKFFETTNDKTYLEEAKKLAGLGSELAPSRLEFIEIRIKIAEVEKDDETLNKLKKLFKQLRPDVFNVRFATSTLKK